MKSTQTDRIKALYTDIVHRRVGHGIPTGLDYYSKLIAQAMRLEYKLGRQRERRKLKPILDLAVPRIAELETLLDIKTRLSEIHAKLSAELSAEQPPVKNPPLPLLTLAEIHELQAHISGSSSKASKTHTATIAVRAGMHTDPSSWVHSLTRMYDGWARKHGFATHIKNRAVDQDYIVNYISILSPAHECSGSCGYMASIAKLEFEHGLHRVTAQSSYDLEKRRTTCFAEVIVGSDANTSRPDGNGDVRSYTFYPYRLVKDCRTGIKTDDMESVMDGDLSRFHNASS